jgi:hypothetical protein
VAKEYLEIRSLLGKPDVTMAEIRARLRMAREGR